MRLDLAQILFLKSSLKRMFSQVEEESGNEKVVEPQRTLPVHARCEVTNDHVNDHLSIFHL